LIGRLFFGRIDDVYEAWPHGIFVLWV